MFKNNTGGQGNQTPNLFGGNTQQQTGGTQGGGLFQQGNKPTA